MQADYTNNREALVTLLQKYIGGERFEHSIGVEEIAIQLAKQYGVSRKKAGLAGLLHDITKNMNNAALAGKYGLTALSVKTLHGPTASCWLWEHGIVRDTEVLTAIKYHTTGRADMSLLDKIIYIADYIEPMRDFDGVETLREAARRDLDEAMLLGLELSINDIMRKGTLIDFNSIEAYNYYRWLANNKTENPPR